MSDAVLGLMETMSHEYGRDVLLTKVHRHGSWRAECCGVIAQSQVSPENALLQLADELKRQGTVKRKTEQYPVVHEPRVVVG